MKFRFTHRTIVVYEMVGYFLVIVGLSFHVPFILFYLNDYIGYLLSLSPNSIEPLQAKPQFPNLPPIWFGLPWIITGIVFILQAYFLKKEVFSSPSQSIEFSYKSLVTFLRDLFTHPLETIRQKRNWLYALTLMALLLVFGDRFWPEDLPVNLPSEPAVVEIKERPYRNEKFKIAVYPPTDWHVYLNREKHVKSIVIRKEAADQSKPGFQLDDSLYFVIAEPQNLETHPPNAVSQALIRDFERDFKGIQIIKKEIVPFGEGLAIRIQGRYERSSIVHAAIGLILERMNRTYIIYYGAPSFANENDLETLNGIAKSIEFEK